MPYRFSNYEDAFSYLESLGFKVSNIALNWITPLRSSSKRATLFYNGKDVGYVETPTDILPDEDWAVNIPFEKRSIIPEGVLNAVFGNTGGNEGWENRQFYIETTHFTRMQFGPHLEYVIDALGPESTIRLKTTSSVLELYKTTTNDIDTVNIGIDYPELAQQLRYEFADIIDNVALNRPRPQDFDLTGAHPGYVISLDSNYTCKWLPLSAILGDSVVPEAINAQKLNNLPASEYIHTNNLTEKLTDIVSNNIEQGITVIADDGKLHFQVNSFRIGLTGAVTGEAVVNNLNDVSIFTTYSATSHTHDDRYVKLEGNSIVSGTVGTTRLNTLIGPINGLKFLSNLEENSSTRASIYTYWNVPDVCYSMVIEVNDDEHDSIFVKAGREYILTASNTTNTFEQYHLEYESKVETGIYATVTIDEYIVDYHNLKTTVSNNFELEVSNNVQLDILKTLYANIETGLFAFDGLNLDVENILNLNSNELNINTSVYNIETENNTYIKSLENMYFTATEVTSFETQTFSINAEHMNISLIDNAEFLLSANNVAISSNNVHMHLSDDISIVSNDIIDILIPMGYSLVADSSSETLTANKNINASAVNISTANFFVNAASTSFAGGDATFSNDVYIHGSLHLSGSTSAGSGSFSTGDRFIVLNSGETGDGLSTPGTTSGIEIDRGIGLNVKLFWDESTKDFKIINHTNDTYAILTEEILSSLSLDYVQVSGSTMTGALVLHADPFDNMHAATKQYVDYQVSNHDIEHDDRFLQLTGGTLSGPLTLSNDPINNLDAVTKQYVDNYFINVNGATMVGALTLAHTPVENMHAATKEYVDNTIVEKIQYRRKYYLIGNDIDTEIALQHDLNNLFVFIKIVDKNTGMEVDCGIKHTHNAITLYFENAPLTDSLEVYMIWF